ncbi:MAG: flagellar hook assembly protein FlgD [Pseudomonadota bacterium]
MSTIRPLDDFSTLIPPKVEETRSEGELAQEDFLTLMITQFRNQDPFEPMENGEFLGQIAQFSTVSGIEDLNSSFSSLAASIQGEQALQAASLVGRSVLAVADSGYVSPEQPLRGAVDLEEPVSGLQIDIRNAAGEVVRRLTTGEQPAGLVDFQWNGTDSSGRALPPGNYEVSARFQTGSRVESLETLIRSDIRSVTLGQQGQGMTLNLVGGGELALDKIYSIN